MVKAMKTVSFQKPLNHAAIGVITLLLSLGIAFSPYGKALDTFIYDFFFFLRGPVASQEEIVIVAIDEASFGVLGLQWPWPRSLHAKLIETLYEEDAQTIALDLILSEASSDPEEDRIFSETVSHHPSLILGADIHRIEDQSFSQETLVLPHSSLITPETRIGSINLPVEKDGFIRSIPIAEKVLLPLPVMAAKEFSGEKKEMPSTIGRKINFLGPCRTVKTISYYQALEPKIHLPRNFFKGKLVFIGFSSQNTSDIENTHPDHFPTPFTRWKGGYMPGVEIHATIAQNLLQQTLIQTLPIFWTLLIGLFFSAGMGILFFRLKPIIGLGVLVSAGTLLLLTTFYMFNVKAIHVPVIYVGLPLTALYFASPFVHYIKGLREKNFIRQAFSTYLSPSVVNQLIEFPEQLKLGGEERDITAFFSDIQGFTTISEQLSPEALVELLNEFLTEMTDIILAHNGMVDKFEGDAIIAMFGAPNILENHAEAACRASIDMQKRLVTLRESLRSRGLPELKMRIGLCSGKAVVGNMGSKHRMDYTMMGNTVNTASRLESASKAYGTYTLIANTTFIAAGKTIAAREIDSIRMKGKNESITAYELLGYTDTLTQNVLQTAACYANGLNAYRNRSWDTAILYFEEAIALSPDDGPSRTMITRCRHFQTHPPTPDWDGAHVMETK